MRLCLVTTIVSPHQMPLARQLAARLGADAFTYVATARDGGERTALGWDCGNLPPWVRQTDGATAGMAPDVRRAVRDADVVVCGTRDFDLFEERNCLARPTLYSTERWFKPPAGRWRLLAPAYLRMAARLRRLSRSPWLHYLAMGAWAGPDMRHVARFDGRMWQWGYFVNPSSPLPAPRPRDGALHLLWAGRLLDWKRVDTLIDAAGRLHRAGRRVRLTLVGRGPERAALEARAARLGLAEAMCFQDAVPIADVRRLMREADVYVLPSNGCEGWGTVVNEAMLEGCAVVATREAGSAATLIRDGVNGLLFRAGDAAGLAAALLRLEADEPLRQRLASAGQQAMLAEWTPAVAADRLLAFAEAVLAGRAFSGYAGGPLQALEA